MGRVSFVFFDGLSSLIGFSGALLIFAHYSGRTLTVPNEVHADSFLARLIGADALAVMVSELRGQKINVPSLAVYKHHRDLVVVSQGLRKNKKPCELAKEVGCSPRRINLLVNEARRLGLVGVPG